MSSLGLQQAQFLLIIATYILLVLSAFALVALTITLSLFVREFKNKRNNCHDKEIHTREEASQSNPHPH